VNKDNQQIFFVKNSWQPITCSALGKYMGVHRILSTEGNVEILFCIETSLFRLLTFQCKWTFTKHVTVSTPQRKCHMKAHAQFVSI